MFLSLFSSFLASLIATLKAAPLDIPTNIPSISLTSLLYLKASKSLHVSILSITFKFNILGIKASVKKDSFIFSLNRSIWM